MRELKREALGIGVRRPHFRGLLEEIPPALGYLEIISESFLGAAPRLDRVSGELAARAPVVLHGVGLNLLGHEDLDSRYLDSIAALAERVDAPFVTDHLCWSRAGGISHHDLLPVPLTDEIAELAVSRITQVKSRIGRPFGVENVSSYVTFQRSTLSEWELLARVVAEADCGLLLDVNNIYVSSVNHGFDPRQYLAAIEPGRVLQIHLAGHTREPSGVIVDTHDAPVADPVWELYRDAWQQLGPTPTLLEWDARIPSLTAVVEEVSRARAFQSPPIAREALR